MIDDLLPFKFAPGSAVHCYRISLEDILHLLFLLKL